MLSGAQDHRVIHRLAVKRVDKVHELPVGDAPEKSVIPGCLLQRGGLLYRMDTIPTYLGDFQAGIIISFQPYHLSFDKS